MVPGTSTPAGVTLGEGLLGHGSWAMFDEGEWKDTDGGALLPPQQHLLAPAGSLPKQHRQILGSSSCTESPRHPRPLPGASESESGLAGRPGRNHRRGLKRRAASPSPVIAPGAGAEPEPEPAGRSQGKGSSAAAPGVSKEQSSQELGAAAAPSLSRKQWRNKQKNKRRQKNKFKVGAGQGPNAGPDQATPAQPQSELSGALRARMEERLQSARFRYINQQLYTSSSQEAAQFFQQDPEAFTIYHRGFSQQVGRWPENPVHRIIQYLRARPASLVVADFGCGDCKIATSVRNKVHSFDLVALNPCVTVCDMAKVPLADESVDVAVFCLALMGTNLREILEEANRVLKPRAVLKLVEVASRFVDIQAFINAMTQLGFQIVSKALGNRYFAALDFRKRGAPRAGGAPPGLRLRPCRYKPR